MPDRQDDPTPRPPAQAAPPSPETLERGAASRGVLRNAHDAPDDAPPLPEPPRERITGRNFEGAGTWAADQRRQAAERGEGLGAGGADNRDARQPAQSDGDVPVDDQD
jgi:hypothetical protein